MRSASYLHTIRDHLKSAEITGSHDEIVDGNAVRRTIDLHDGQVITNSIEILSHRSGAFSDYAGFNANASQCLPLPPFAVWIFRAARTTMRTDQARTVATQ